MHKKLTSLSFVEPHPSQIRELRTLWKEAFGDSDAFFDTFEKTAFSSSHCRCAVLQDSIVAALYWFDCEFQEKPIAYIYGVATAKEFRGQGIGHALMMDTHKILKEKGYIGALLAPASESLFGYYGSMGYETCTYIEEIEIQEDILHIFENNIFRTSNTFEDDITLRNTITSEDDITLQNINIFKDNGILKKITTDKHLEIRKIPKDEFSILRRKFLSNTAVYQEAKNLDFLETQADFYTGDNFLLTAYKEDSYLHGLELLGHITIIPSLLQYFGCSAGIFRIPGQKKAFTMYYPFYEHAAMPDYFGFIFD